MRHGLSTENRFWASLKARADDQDSHTDIHANHRRGKMRNI